MEVSQPAPTPSQNCLTSPSQQRRGGGLQDQQPAQSSSRSATRTGHAHACHPLIFCGWNLGILRTEILRRRVTQVDGVLEKQQLPHCASEGDPALRQQKRPRATMHTRLTKSAAMPIPYKGHWRAQETPLSLQLMQSLDLQPEKNMKFTTISFTTWSAAGFYFWQNLL